MALSIRAFSAASRRRMATLASVLASDLKAMHDAGTHKKERVITSSQQSHINVAGWSRPSLNLCANNYLGLSNNPELVAAAKSALDTHGFGLSSVRFICGTRACRRRRALAPTLLAARALAPTPTSPPTHTHTPPPVRAEDIHKQLEARIAAFHGMEDAILFPSCFDANAGIFEALLGPEDAVISDEKNHASIIDGIRLCKAQRERYRHRDMADLEEKLAATAGKRLRMIVTDGVFSMDGTVAPLQAITALAKKYDASVFIDECHATGFFGATGRGTDEHTGTRGKIDIINSTLGKAMGGATGGYTASTKAVVDVLRNKARPYLFSNSVAPAIVGASLKVFDMLEAGSGEVAKLRALTHKFRDGMTALGFTLSGDRDHPIVPVMLGDARLAAQFADAMLKRGVYVIGFSYPVVPKGAARIRTQISAAHSDTDIDAALSAFAEVGREMGVVRIK
jgi:glycine C-acetyltransferase